MILDNIILEEECILREIPGETEILGITANPAECTPDTLLIIPNEEKLPDFSEIVTHPVAILCSANCKTPEEIKTVKVENPRRAIAFAYARFYGIDFSRSVNIGITGTNGKTSTATFIKHILKDAGYKVGFIGTGKIELDGRLFTDEYYSMTTPDPELLYRSIAKMHSEGCDAIVMEISSHALTLSKVVPIPFDYAIFTNLSPEHLDFHGDIESYYQAKLSLFTKCKTAIFNVDDYYARRAENECKTRKISVGALYSADIYAREVLTEGFSGSEYLYHGKNFVFKTRLKLPGIYNVYNSMLAATLAIDMGIKPCEVKNSLSKIKSIEGRFDIIKDTVTVIIDYAHTDVALRSLLKSISSAKAPSQRLTVVFGCGGDRDKSKRPRMAENAEKFADRIIVTSDNCRSEEPMEIISDVIKGFKKRSFTVIENREDAIREAIISSPEDGVVAIVGKGAEKYNIDKDGYHSFDEKKIVKKALAERKRMRDFL